MNPASRYAMVGAAVTLTVNKGTCDDCSAAVGGLTHMAVKAPSVAGCFSGQRKSLMKPLPRPLKQFKVTWAMTFLAISTQAKNTAGRWSKVIVNRALTKAAARA